MSGSPTECIRFFDGQTEEPRIGGVLSRGYWRLVLVRGRLEHFFGPYKSKAAAEKAAAQTPTLERTWQGDPRQPSPNSSTSSSLFPN